MFPRHHLQSLEMRKVEIPLVLSCLRGRFDKEILPCRLHPEQKVRHFCFRCKMYYCRGCDHSLCSEYTGEKADYTLLEYSRIIFPTFQKHIEEKRRDGDKIFDATAALIPQLEKRIKKRYVDNVACYQAFHDMHRGRMSHNTRLLLNSHLENIEREKSYMMNSLESYKARLELVKTEYYIVLDVASCNLLPFSSSFAQCIRETLDALRKKITTPRIEMRQYRILEKRSHDEFTVIKYLDDECSTLV